MGRDWERLRTDSGENKLIGITTGGADRDGNSAGCREASGALGGGLLSDPLGGGRVELGEA